MKVQYCHGLRSCCSFACARNKKMNNCFRTREALHSTDKKIEARVQKYYDGFEDFANPTMIQK